MNEPIWDAAALHAPHARADKAARVERMFDAIAPTYERVNAVASLGQDARWRRRAVDAANVRGGDIVLDICCGTGDMTRALAALTPAPQLVLGLDFSAGMLASGVYTQQSGAPIQLLRADGLRLPLADATVDVITCAFGVRNFQNLAAGLREMRRVLRPGGRVVILEFSQPRNPLFRWGHHWYTEIILPRLGQWISRDPTNAYRYLPRSIATFADVAEFERSLRDAGFGGVRRWSLNLGGVSIYRATPESA